MRERTILLFLTVTIRQYEQRLHERTRGEYSFSRSRAGSRLLDARVPDSVGAQNQQPRLDQGEQPRPAGCSKGRQVSKPVNSANPARLGPGGRGSDSRARPDTKGPHPLAEATSPGSDSSQPNPGVVKTVDFPQVWRGPVRKAG